MTEKRFTIDDEGDIIEFDWNTNEYIDDFRWGDGKSWDRVCNRLNELYEEKEQLKLICQDHRDHAIDFKADCIILEKENEQLKQELQKIQDDFELNWTQNRVEFDKDKLYIKDTNTETCLDDKNLSIRVYIPSLNEYYQFKYQVTGRSLMKEFIEKYNSKGDDEND